MKTNAGFWRRVAAYLIDAIIINVAVNIISFILILIAGVWSVHHNPKNTELAGLIVICIVLTIDIVGMWLYFAFFESSRLQATPGKLAISSRVTDLEGNRISFGRATGRFFGKYVSELILMIGFMMAGWTKKKQALHDMMAGTLVVKRGAQE
jgi:uncharacterized RDD family membrane protein YckC